jgi:molybdenum cofactor guanylyltransferase
LLRRHNPQGVILAGGRGSRIGGGKATVALAGRPLITYPLTAMRAVLGQVAVIAKAETPLPALPDVTVWIEPEEPSHPLLGIAEALALADGRPVLTCPADMPFVTPELLERVLSAHDETVPATVVVCGGRLEPLLGCYWPVAAPRLLAAALVGESATTTVAELEPILVDVPVASVHQLFNVNTPDDLLQTSVLLPSVTGKRANSVERSER